MAASDVRQQVLAALTHPEAEEGLYLDNFFHLHEEDERPRVAASQEEILDALKELIAEGRVETDESE
ncbi:MAG: hypothetical protein KDD69_06755, partial [Bdellovibrionales bacterium]|nr:hypothetical protein [Bdellovibrionales bacterium]